MEEMETTKEYDFIDLDQIFHKIDEKYCEVITDELKEYTIKSLTNITRQARNEEDILAFKSAMAYSDLTKIFFKFTHDCSYQEHCLRSKTSADFIVVVNSLAKLIDDSYRHSTRGFMAKLKHQHWQVTENITREQAPKKKSAINIGGLKIPIKDKRKEEDEYDD